MTYQQEKELGTYLWQGGERLDLAKIPDRFTVRLKRNVQPAAVSTAYQVAHRGGFQRQRLEAFTVDASERDVVVDWARQGR